MDIKSAAAVGLLHLVANMGQGNNDKCPIVENFGSFAMDMFNAKSDLDLSINFTDPLFEADRVAKIKTLRKFAKKFYALRKGGHVTTVELILSARVPVLKVTDSGSGIECDLSVGNRDGITKSHIIFMISAIDERFQKLSFMVKAWAKAHDINSSKDGTLNSLSLILLVAVHLQTRDIPILPPFSAILRDGADPVAVRRLIPSYLSYGKRNKESLAQLFVSLLIKLESVETLWSRGLCASSYEGSWMYKSWKAAGCISIEDFTDRSQNTARAVKSAYISKIYSCIRGSVEQIRSFTVGFIDADRLKYLLFGKLARQSKKVMANVNYSTQSKPISKNPIRSKKKHPAKGGPAERQIPEKQGKHCDNPCSSEASAPSRKGGIKKKSGTGSVALDGPTEGQRPGKQGKHCDNPCSSEAPAPSGNVGVKKKLGIGRKTGLVALDGPAEGQRPGKQGKNCDNPCSSKAPTPSRKSGVKKKSVIGRKTGLVASDGPAEGQKPGKQGKHFKKICSSEAPTPSETCGENKMSGTRRKSDPVTSDGPAEGQRPGKKIKHCPSPGSLGAPTPSKKRRVKKTSRTGRNSGPVISDTLISTSLQGLDKSQQTLTGISCQPPPLLPIQSSGGFQPQRADIEALNSVTQRTRVNTLSHTAPNSLERQPLTYSNPYVQGSGGIIPDRTRVEALRHTALNRPPHQPSSFSGYGGIKPEMTYFETMKYSSPQFSQEKPLPHYNYPQPQSYGGFNSERTHVETSRNASNFSAGTPFSVSNSSIQGFGRYMPDRMQGETLSYSTSQSRLLPRVPDRMQGETLSYSTSQSRLLPRANLAAEYGQRAHAETISHASPNLQTPLHYTLAPGPSSSMPSHQPYNSAIPCINPSGLQRSHYPPQSFSHVPSQFPANMYPYQS
ncbi:uncharacterized protein LOC104909118 isoform X2 [Beta vulgaris subsp. vulgaris]|uniref:uncharacterized protein LOC104909118 isoform X2 n=1 Tax=Beta vulgaris subsp. vulgaris TaxID=3555 RepID=UPI00053F35AD|nr:uncharacterized protein LOC104909118 isoform X2 [Beta vulgaris subsp. vulgaris]XP_048495176.1 uncharacterized protein LOC104909118 isoform X2 [Beta vulgaris subsp. vulgaris]